MPPDEALLDIYNLPGLIFVIACYTFPYVFILIANALGTPPADMLIWATRAWSLMTPRRTLTRRRA